MSQETPDASRYIPSISDDHLHTLGVVAFWSGRIERILIELLGVLVSNDVKIGQIVADGMQFQEAVRLVSALVEAQDDADLRVGFLAVKPDLLNAMKSRNELLHGDWDTAWGDATTTTLISIRRSGRSEQIVTHERLVGSARALASAANRLTALLQDFVFASEGDDWFFH